MKSKYYHFFFLLSILILYFVLSVGSALHESLTFDEIVHIEEGLNHLTYHTFAVDTNNPPLIRELAAIPLVFGLGRFIPTDIPSQQALPARFVTILLGGALLVAVFFFSRRYFGMIPAMLSVLLLAFEPAFLAHSHYVTLDTGFTLFFFLACWALWRWVKRPTVINTVLFGIVFGLAASSKVSAWIFMVGIIGVFLFLQKTLFVRLIRPKQIILVLVSCLLTIWATYFFTSDVVVAQRQDVGRVSSKLEAYAQQTHNQWLQIGLYVLKYQPIPLGNYMATLKNNALRAHLSSDTFFLGRTYPSVSWYFLPVNFLLKTPLPLLIFFGLFLIQLIRNTAFRKNTEIIWVPLLTIFTISSLLGLQPWVRYLLPAYPFLAIAGALVIANITDRYLRYGAVFLVGWLIAGTLAQFPHFISYANELSGFRVNRYTKFADSNIDWGQSLPDLAQYVQKEKPKSLTFSYFGRDNGDNYGLVSNRPYGSYTQPEICAFHEIPYGGYGERIVAISVTNWYQCGYITQPQYQKDKIRTVVGDSILIF